MPTQASFTAAGMRSIITTSIAHSTWETESGASILRTLKSAGLGIREKDFYAIRREILGLKRFEEQVKRLRPDSRVPVSWIDEAPGWELKGNFLYQARVSGRDPITGETITRFFATSTDQELFKETAESAVMDSLIGEEEFYNIIPEEVELFHVFHRVGHQFVP
jgi:hypothetical protein